MSTNPPPPPDRPTERLQPSPPPRQVYEERVAPAVVDRDAVLLRIEDALSSLRTGLMIVGVLAVAALGVAIYALLKEDDTNGGGSRSGLATDDRVSQLDDRIDRISRQVQDLRAGEAGGDDVDERVGALEETVERLADRPVADPQEAIDELSGRIDDLAQDVESLKGAQPAP